MQASKGIAIGFVAGLVVAGGAVLLLRDESVPRADDGAQVAALSAKIDRLERTMSQQSLQTPGQSPAAAASATRSAENVPAVDPREEQARIEEQQRVIASADATVEQAIQAGQWSLEQARDLDRLTVDLPPEERSRIHTRITAAINNDQIKLRVH